jgi:enoyl-CoA hydratase/carnithine racemase
MENILLEKNEHIAILTINHPPANTWNLATMEDFKTAIDDVDKDREVRVVIITGSGDGYFSAGFDVKDAANGPKTSPIGRELWTRLDRFEKPTIAAMNGHALGGGLELALSCHFRIMANNPKALVGLTELNLGIIPGWGGTQRLTQVVGKAKALDMILFSKTASPEQALEMGLVNQLSTPERLMDDALEFAGKLAQRAPLAVGCVLKAMSAGAYEGMDRGLAVETEGTFVVRDSEDCKEGFAAFVEKRPPVFKGR